MGSSKAIITAGILLVTLVVPALLFVFLHTFGENEFTIPIYYQDGVPLSREPCSWQSGQYQIPDFELIGEDRKKVTSTILDQKISIIRFEPNVVSPKANDLYQNLLRVMTAFNNSPGVQLLSLSASSTNEPRPSGEVGSWLLLRGQAETIADLANCGFIVPATDFPDLDPEHQLVLVDAQRRIRGYYDIRTNEEIDRLITEIEILKLEPSYEQK